MTPGLPDGGFEYLRISLGETFATADVIEIIGCFVNVDSEYTDNFEKTRYFLLCPELKKNVREVRTDSVKSIMPPS